MAEYTIHEIKYPEKKTYWIFWVDKVSNFTYGFVDTDQVVEGYAEQTWTTTVESEWIDKLKTEFNTEVAPEEQVEEQVERVISLPEEKTELTPLELKRKQFQDRLEERKKPIIVDVSS